MGSVHEFNDALVGGSLEPFVSWDGIGLAANIKLNIWDSLLLRDCTVARVKGIWEHSATELVLDELIEDQVIVSVWDHVK